MEITTIGLDLAKNVFQVYGVDAEGTVILRKKLRRSDLIGVFEGLPPVLIGMEACGTVQSQPSRESRLDPRGASTHDGRDLRSRQLLVAPHGDAGL